MNQKKRILVIGATGAQGGSVARALLADDRYIVRILTRNPTGDKAIDLLAEGAEVVSGDLEDLQSLKRAMKDCYGVFGVTNYSEHFHREYHQGVNLINAVSSSGIKHFVFHTLPDYYKLSGGKFPVPEFDIKAKLQRYCLQLDIPTTFVQVAFYYENFLSGFPLAFGPDNKWHFGFPQGHTKLAMASVQDVGPVVASVFNNPVQYIGRTIGVVGEDETCTHYAETMSRVLHDDVSYEYIPRELYLELYGTDKEEIANMFEVQRLHIPSRQLDLEESLRLNPAMTSFEEWLRENVHEFEARFEAIHQPVLAY
ncbi:MAG TPA: NmrA/HSCARG family protein [Flavitalea sp.]|nr:NmrA/HSCARG family protein [Flavitalea sp.]